MPRWHVCDLPHVGLGHNLSLQALTALPSQILCEPCALYTTQSVKMLKSMGGCVVYSSQYH